jgi:hypothetical protein
MASKAKKMRFLRSQSKSGSLKKKLIFGLLGLFAFLVIAGFINGFLAGREANRQRVLGESRFQDALTTILGPSSGAKKFPLILRQRVERLVEMNSQGRLEFVVSGEEKPGNPNTIMDTSPDGDKPRITVYAPWLNHFAETHSQTALFSTVAVVLYHESVHVERWPVSHKTTKEEDLEEEIRAYSRTSLEVIRSMRGSGLWIMSGFIMLDDILQQCNEQSQCPEFRKAVQEYFQAAPRS